MLLKPQLYCGLHMLLAWPHEGDHAACAICLLADSYPIWSCMACDHHLIAQKNRLLKRTHFQSQAKIRNSCCLWLQVVVTQDMVAM